MLIWILGTVMEIVITATITGFISVIYAAVFDLSQL